MRRWPFLRSRFFCWSGSRRSGERGDLAGMGLMGSGRGRLHHRVLARHRRPRRDVERRARWAADWGDRDGDWLGRCCCVKRKDRDASNEAAMSRLSHHRVWHEQSADFQTAAQSKFPRKPRGNGSISFIAAQLEGVSRSRVQLLHRPGRCAGEWRAREGLAEAARRRADRASPASRIRRR